MTKDPITILLYTDQYADQLVEFIRKVWDKNLTREIFFEKQNRDTRTNPYGKECGSPIVLALYKDMVVGHIALKPCGFLLNGKEVAGYWQAGIHVLPEFRGRGLATKMSEMLIKNTSVVTGFFVIEQTLKLKKRLGWDLPGKIPEYIKFIRPKELMTKINLNNIEMVPDSLKKLFTIIQKFGKTYSLYLFSMFIKVFNNGIKFLNTQPDITNIKIVNDFDKRIDDIWDNNKKYIINSQVRKADYLNWAFDSNKGWIKAIYEVNDKVLGYIILSLKQFKTGTRLSNIISASIIDIYWDFLQPDIFKALILFCEQYSFSNGAEILFCTINHIQAEKWLKRSAFIKIPKSVYFSIYTPNANIQYSKKLSDWFLTRGDADAAGALGQEIRG